nr:unnamed protein product [Callosobruchus analis]
MQRIEHQVVADKESGGDSFVCYYCEYTASSKLHLIGHMKMHECNAMFKEKGHLQEHIVQKHPEFITSVTSRIHECTMCNFKTISNDKMQEHLLKHSTKRRTCSHCNAAFTKQEFLNEHILQIHPQFTASISRKLWSCQQCTFKTAISRNFQRHLLEHPETAVNYKFSVCIHCNEPFKSITMLDEHIIKKHPKIHKCTTCDFNTTILTEFKRHQLKHTDRNSNICVHCNKSFLNKTLLDDHIVKKHPSFIYSVTSKIRECTKCSYKTTIAGYLKRHMVQHPDGIPATKYLTGVCTVRTLDEHIIKNHPSYISSVTNKIHKCTKCNFKTVDKRTLRRHVCQNDTQDLTCIHCNAMFKQKLYLQEHVIQNHPESVMSVTSRIHECTMCNFKTMLDDKLHEHLLKHTETTYTCMHCNTAFKTHDSLNEHIIKKHPKFIASITRKIHACTKCNFKTVYTSSFQCHLLKHPETAAACIHCNEPFKSITMLDEHIIKKHPSSIPSITRKIHKCTTCDFSTTIHTEFKRHQLKHTDAYIKCMYCDKTFIHKRTLGEHIIKNHPSYISSVTNKIHECTKCNFKTVDKRTLRRHGCQNVEVTELVLS